MKMRTNKYICMCKLICMEKKMANKNIFVQLKLQIRIKMSFDAIKFEIKNLTIKMKSGLNFSTLWSKPQIYIYF